MDIFFQDPNEVPLPPDEVKIEDFSAEPYPDQRRIRVKLTLTPFQKRPHIEIFILNPEGQRISEVSILESMTKNVDLTMHLKTAQPSGTYKIEAIVYYSEENEDPTEEDEPGQALPEPKIVDRSSEAFELAGS